MNSTTLLAWHRLLAVLSLVAALLPNLAGAAVTFPIAFTPIGIPYSIGLTMEDSDSAETPPGHVGAWSWDEDGFPDTTRGWTHTSRWVKLDLLQPARFTLLLESRANVPWPGPGEPNRLAGTNLYPSFSLYRGWDTDIGPRINGVVLDQEDNFNNRGNIAWAEDVTYVDHLDNSTAHSATRTWTLAAGRYTINLGGNSPAIEAEGRQGYRATFTTASVPMLDVAQSGTNVIVRWSASITGYQLHCAPTPTGPWNPVEGSPDTSSGWQIQTTARTEAAQFFRLQK